MDLGGRLVNQEHASCNQNQVATRETEVPDVNDVIVQLNNPEGEEQHRHASDKRHAEPDELSAFPQFFRKVRREDGDENDVVDSEDDFQNGQRRQGNPHSRVGDKFEHGLTLIEGDRMNRITGARKG